MQVTTEDPFVSSVVSRWSSPHVLKQPPPVRERYRGAVMVVDVSGFTDLTDRLARAGQTGVDRIQAVLGRYFTALVELVEQHGGVVFGFEGDSLTACWCWPREDRAPQVRALVRRCAAAVHDQLGKQDFEPDLRLRQRIAVGVGGIDVLHFGLATGRRHVVLSGAAVESCAQLLLETEAGETSLDPETAPQVADAPPLQPTGTRRETAALSAAPIATGDARDLAPYLPRVLRRRPAGDRTALVGEIRTVSVAFLKIAPAKSADDPKEMNRIVTVAQSAIDRQDGDLLRITRDGRDLSMLCVFGLPLVAHENDAERAVMAAAEIRDGLAELAPEMSAGIATGRVFCGPLGPDHRRDYTVHGTTVNAAARLCAVAGGRTYVDAATRAAIRSVAFTGPWMLRLAGIRRAVEAFLPTAHRNLQGRSVETALVGRKSERARLRQLWHAAPALALVHGVPGIGKSALVAAAATQARGDDLSVLDGVADAMDSLTPYLAWRRVLRACLDADTAETDRLAFEAHVNALLTRCMGSADFAPLLNDVIDLRIAETRLTLGMGDAVRADNLRRLLVAIICDRLHDRPHLVLIEDAQWMDDASWALLSALTREAPPACFLLTCRSEARAQIVDTRLADIAIELHEFGLDPLDAEDIRALAQRILPRHALGPGMVSSLIDTSEGNPLFVEELCRSAETGAQFDGDGPDAVRLPLSLESVILSRVDAMPPGDQAILRQASVLGMRFSRVILNHLPTAQAATDDFEAAVGRIVGLDLFRVAGPGMLAFRHQIIRDLLYSGMLSAQRASAHAEVAKVLETQGDREGAERLPTILAHWRAAGHGQAKKTAEYLDQVAALRLRQNDPTGAATLLGDLFEMIETAGVTVPSDRLAMCHLMHGRAMLGTGRMRASLASYQTGLAMLGQPLPSGGGALARQLIANALRQCRPVSRMPIGAVGDDPDPNLDAAGRAFLHSAQAHETLTRIYYFAGDKKRLLLSALSAANCAERCGAPTPSQAVSYASLGAICGTIPLRRRAAAYLRRAEALAKAFDDAGTDGRVALLSGLYDTSIGAWATARDRFETGLAAARRTGDARLWYEHAVCLETICGPWLLTPAFAGWQDWEALCQEILDAGRDRNDMQVFACGALGYARGCRVSERPGAVATLAADLRMIVSDDQREVEAIHRIEALAHLADLALDHNDTETAMHWLGQGTGLLADLNAKMKSRTMAALSLFHDAVERADTAGGAPQPLQRLRRLATGRFFQFARVYRIGLPEALRCKGDGLARAGRTQAARRAWRRGLAAADRLEMPRFAGLLRQRLAQGDNAPPAPETGPSRAAMPFRPLKNVPPGFRDRLAKPTPLEVLEAGDG
ncbi:MAG: AAA family ATPase [Pseudomonadota bacterium]